MLSITEARAAAVELQQDISFLYVFLACFAVLLLFLCACSCWPEITSSSRRLTFLQQGGYHDGVGEYQQEKNEGAVMAHDKAAKQCVQLPRAHVIQSLTTSQQQSAFGDG
jgi:hypothetical protein